MTATSARRSGSRRRCQPGSPDHACAAEEVARLLRAIKPPEEDLDALLQVLGRTLVVDDAVLGGGEHGLGVREALAHGVRPGQQQDGVEADALRDG